MPGGAFRPFLALVATEEPPSKLYGGEDHSLFKNLSLLIILLKNEYSLGRT